MTTQAELFETRQVGNLTLFETSRLAHGQENSTGLISRPPIPAPASPLPPFARRSETSRQAAIAKYDAGTAPSQREIIYRLIMFAGDKGQTREEIAEKLELSGDTVRPRIKELLGEAKHWPDPFIKRNGETRKTKSGLSAEILVAI